MQLGRLSILSLIHCVSDCYTTFLPALQLPLAAALGLTNTQTGLLIGIGLLPANVFQPLFGSLFDRFNAKWFVIVGPLLVAGCMSLLGLSHGLLLTMSMILIGMSGAGMFHPEAATLAGRFGASGSARTMALFLGGGFIGQALGPWWITSVISRPGRGFEDSWLTIFPGLVVLALGAVMVARLKNGHPDAQVQPRRSLWKTLAGRHRPVWTLIGMNIARYFGLQMIFFALTLYLKARGGTVRDVGQWMMIFNGAQGAGILIGGLIAPRHRERMMLILSLAMALVPACLLPLVEGPGALLCLQLIGLCVASTFPVGIQLGQSIVPGAERWISGTLIGFSWGIGALTAAPLANFVGERFKPEVAFVIAAAMLVVALVLAVALPGQSHLNRLKAAG